MDSFSTGIWTISLTVGAVLLIWLWARTKRNAGPGGIWASVTGKIRAWVGAVGEEEFIEGEERSERLYRELTARLMNVERSLTHQNQLEDLAVDLRRRLHRLEQSTTQEFSEPHSDRRGIPRSVVRLGVRITLSDVIWKALGIVQPWDISDHQLDRIIQGPFCRNCLRSLVALYLIEGERSVRHQCRHCLLSWRVDPTITSIPLRQFKRELYELLDEEYRKTGAIGTMDEV